MIHWNHKFFNLIQMEVKMKKTLALLACGVVMFGAIGCGKKQEEGAPATSSAQPSTTQEAPASSSTSTESTPSATTSTESSPSSTPAPSTTEQAPSTTKK